MRPAPAAGSRGRTGSVTWSRSCGWELLVEGEVQLEHVHAGLAQEADEAPVGVVVDQRLDPRRAARAAPARCGSPGCARWPPRCGDRRRSPSWSRRRPVCRPWSGPACSGRSSARNSAIRCFVRSNSSCWFGPWFTKPVAFAAYVGLRRPRLEVAAVGSRVAVGVLLAASPSTRGSPGRSGSSRRPSRRARCGCRPPCSGTAPGPRR